MGGKKEIYRDIRFFHGALQFYAVAFHSYMQRNAKALLLSLSTRDLPRVSTLRLYAGSVLMFCRSAIPWC